MVGRTDAAGSMGIWALQASLVMEFEPVQRAARRCRYHRMGGGRCRTRSMIDGWATTDERSGALRRGRSMSGGHDEQLCGMADARS